MSATTATLLTREQIAHKLAVTPGTVSRWERAGIIPAIRINAGCIRYDEAEVMAAIRAHAASKGAAR